MGGWVGEASSSLAVVQLLCPRGGMVGTVWVVG